MVGDVLALGSILLLCTKGPSCVTSACAASPPQGMGHPMFVFNRVVMCLMLIVVMS